MAAREAFGVEVGAGDRHQVVQRQQHRAPQLDDERRLRRAEGGLHPVRPVRGVLGGVPPAPLAHRRDVQVQLAGQRLDPLRAGADVLPDGRGRGGFLVQSDQHALSLALRSSGSPDSASSQSR